ncbi:hypothetical protein AB7C87_21290 [Natrarchaeobius sp. A-rgal3]|uniref:hypothetical protein n=1 Tax=Natrarchaeobius versutus TaxID=1679078 RepID=UPI00350FB5C4
MDDTGVTLVDGDRESVSATLPDGYGVSSAVFALVALFALVVGGGYANRTHT